MHRRHTRKWFFVCVALMVGIATASPAQASRRMSARQYLQGVSARLNHIWVNVVLADVASTIVENDPFNDPRRAVTLRLHFSGSGQLEGAKVLRSSGYKPFDQTALHAVLLSHSYPKPPKSVLSDNGHVYLDWTFRRSKPHTMPAAKTIYRKLLPTRKAVRKFLRQGRFDRAVARLRLAYRQGRLPKAGHAFGLEVIRLAAIQGKTVDAQNFVRTLTDPAMPLEVFRALLSGLVGAETQVAIVKYLVQRRQAVADRVLAQQFRHHYPARKTQSLVFMRGLLQRPGGAALVRKKLQLALKDSHPEIAAGAAALLLRSRRPADRNPAMALLMRMLKGSETQQLAALKVVGRVARESHFYATVEKLALKTDASQALRLAAMKSLASYGTRQALKKLLILTYQRKKPALQLAALQALASQPRLAKAFCYRLQAVIAKPRKKEMLRIAGHAIARGCMADMPFSVRIAARSRRWPVRAGVAEGLAEPNKKSDTFLLKLARDPVTAVRTAALRKMAEQRRPAFQRALVAASGYGTAEQKRLGLLFTKDKRRLGKALRKQRGEWWLRIARHAIVARPHLTFPHVLRLLNRSDWESRLQGAWVLMAFPPTR